MAKHTNNMTANALKKLRRTAAKRNVWVEVTNMKALDLHGSRHTIRAFLRDRYNRPALIASVAFRGPERAGRLGVGVGYNFRPLTKFRAALLMDTIIRELPHDDYLLS